MNFKYNNGIDRVQSATATAAGRPLKNMMEIGLKEDPQIKSMNDENQIIESPKEIYLQENNHRPSDL
jgi:hypothetical protein